MFHVRHCEYDLVQCFCSKNFRRRYTIPMAVNVIWCYLGTGATCFSDRWQVGIQESNIHTIQVYYSGYPRQFHIHETRVYILTTKLLNYNCLMYIAKRRHKACFDRIISFSLFGTNYSFIEHALICSL